SVVRSMQVIARRSHAACHSFFTVRRVTSVCARRSTALVFTRTASIQSRLRGMPRLGWSSRPWYWAMAVSEGEMELDGEIASRSRPEFSAVGILSERVMKSLFRTKEAVRSLHLTTSEEPGYSCAPRVCHSFSKSALLQNDFCVPI